MSSDFVQAKYSAYEKLATAAVVLLAVLTFGILAYLGIWYYLRRRVRYSRRQQAQDNLIFSQSAVSLPENTSKALDEFLMTDVQPQRTSIICGSGRSPSITMVFDDAYQDSPPHSYLTSHDSSASTLVPGNAISGNVLTPNTLSPVNTLSQTTTSGSIPSVPTSSMIVEATSTPRESISLNPSVRSSRNTTSVGTHAGSASNGASISSNHSQRPQSPVSPLASRDSRGSISLSSHRSSLQRSNATQSQSERLSGEIGSSRASAAFSFEISRSPSLEPSVLIDVSHNLDQSQGASHPSPGSSTFRHSFPT